MITVTYGIRSAQPIDAEKKARAIALGQTTDTWTPNARSGLKKLEKHRGVVLHTEGTPLPSGLHPHYYRLTISYPEANTENDLPTLLTMIFGKISLDGRIKLEHIEFSPAFLKGKGPRFGIEGLRKLVKEPKKPLTMAIFKPCVGLSPRELADMFYELAMGGMHFVKDDEILPDLPICPTEKRLQACLEAGEKARRETGRRTLYAVNLTGRPSAMLLRAKRLARQGAQCFLFNVLAYGYGLLEELRSVGVPIMAHPALAGALSSSSEYGMSYEVTLGSLMRVGGADLVLFPSSYGTVALPHEETEAIRDALTSKSILKRAFPVPSAGIHPGLVPKILADYGNEVVINAGGGVHGHPGGPRAGAKAFRQAVDGETDAVELKEALRLWG